MEIGKPVKRYTVVPPPGEEPTGPEDPRRAPDRQPVPAPEREWEPA